MVIQPIPSQLGPYQVLDELGHGEIMIVVLARHEKTGEDVVLKIFPPEFTRTETAQTIIEQQITGLQHPYILPTRYDFDERSGRPYFVSPFLPGGALNPRLGEKPFPLEEAHAILQRLAVALDYAHEKGLIHKTVKPTNILFGEKDRALLTGFGYQDLVSANITLQLQAPGYMSPEQQRGETLTPATDTYSLGTILFEMLTGKFISQISADRRKVATFFNPDLPEGVQEIFDKALEPRPSSRYALAEEMAFHLDLRIRPRGSEEDKRLQTLWTGAVRYVDGLPHNRKAATDPNLGETLRNRVPFEGLQARAVRLILAEIPTMMEPAEQHAALQQIAPYLDEEQKEWAEEEFPPLEREDADELNELSEIVEADADLILPVRTILHSLVSEAKNLYGGKDRGSFRAKLEEARALWKKWNGHEEEWRAAFAYRDELTTRLDAIPSESPALEKLRAALKQLTDTALDHDTPESWRTALEDFAARLAQFAAPTPIQSTLPPPGSFSLEEPPPYQQTAPATPPADPGESRVPGGRAEPLGSAPTPRVPALPGESRASLGRAESPTERVLHEVVVIPTNGEPPIVPKEGVLTLEITKKYAHLTTPADGEYRSPHDLGLKKYRETSLLSPEGYGELLFGAIFHQKGYRNFTARPTLAGYQAALARAGERLKIELRVEADLPAHHWEYLKDPTQDTPLTVRPKTPFTRLHSGAAARPPLPPPIRVLFAICNPLTLHEPGAPIVGDLVKLDIPVERNIIDEAMQPLVGLGLADYEVMVGTPEAPVTLEAVRDRLRPLGPRKALNVLHLLAHGVYLPRANRFALVMEGPGQVEDFVYPEEFDSASFEDDLRLVVLAACQSGNLSFETNFQALAPRLVENSVPAVIAMQRNMPIDAAQVFTRQFYGDLARTGRLDTALAETRHDLYTLDKQSWTWGIPLLLMSTSNARLFTADPARAGQFPRPALADLKLKSYAELGGDQQAARQRLREAIERQAQLHGFSADPRIVQTIAQAIASPGVAPREEGPPLALPQDRREVGRLAPKVQMSAQGLRDYVLAHSGIELEMSAFYQIASALNAGKHIILIGPPGTGKTSLAQDIVGYAQAGENRFSSGQTLATASADWTTFDTVGGYVPTAQGPLQFKPGIFLKAISRGAWLVLDEINRAEIDKAFGELFTVLSGQPVELSYTIGADTVKVLPPRRKAAPREAGDWAYWIPEEAKSGFHYVIHPTWRIIGTMNVYDKSSLFAMSFAFMRRFAFVDADLPGDPTMQKLVDRWLKSGGLPLVERVAGVETPLEDLSPLQRKLHHLLQRERENPLMARRALGPAIVEDMIEYIADRHRANPAANDQDQVRMMGEAFLLYVVPQLDGLDSKAIQAIYEHVKTLFAELDEAEKEAILNRIRLLYPHIPWTH